MYVDDVWQAGDEELLAAVAAVQERINRESASLVALVAEIATRGLAEDTGFRDTADLLRTVQNVALSAPLLASWRSRPRTGRCRSEAVPAVPHHR